LKTIAGVDEAGRGSVLGPLVIAAVAIEDRKLPKLSELGVKDSKLLTPARRETLYREIRKLASAISWELIEPKKIDKVVLRGIPLFRLNRLEGEGMARVLANLSFDIAYVDCCDTNQERFGELVANLLFERRKKKQNSKIVLGEKNPFLEIVKSEHHADRNHLAVSAASIVAKVRRDAYIRRLHKTHGLFGSGYPHDETTKSYLKGFVDRAEQLPPMTRLSWATIRNFTDQPAKQTGIDGFTSDPSDQQLPGS
jgi:ribonuclease HII